VEIEQREDSMSLEETVRLLADRQEIVDLNHRLCHLIDSFELDRMVEEVFAVAGSDDHGGGPVVGRDAIRAWYEDSTANVAAVSHNICNAIVEVEGDRATMRSNVIAWVWMTATADRGPLRGADYGLSLTYLDELSRYPEGWRIDSRLLVSNVSKVGSASIITVGELPQTQKGIHALARREPPGVSGR
jgi:SnoaL-like domain